LYITVRYYHYRYHEGKALIDPFQRQLSIYLYSGSVDLQVATNLGTNLPTALPCAKISLFCSPELL